MKKITEILTTVKSEIEHGNDLSYTISSAELLKNNFNKLNERYYIHEIEKTNHFLPKDEDIYILGHSVTEDFPLHSHDYFELTYVANGNILNVIDNNELYMREGDISLITPQAVHELRCMNPDTILVNICIKKSLFHGTFQKFLQSESHIAKLFSDMNEQKYMFFSIAYSKEIPLYINNLIQEYVKANFHQTFSLEAWLLLILDFLANTNQYSYTGIDKKALDILMYIQEHCLSCSLQEMSNALGYNANYLTNYIKRRTGRNYRDIIKETRLKKALYLLSETTLSVYDIAFECGYDSPSHFFRIFKECYHITPKKYREYYNITK